MNALEARRRFAAQICLADMLAVEAGGNYALAELMIGQAQQVCMPALRWQDSATRDFIATLRMRLREAHIAFMAAKRPPTQADIDCLLRVTFVEGTGMIAPEVARDHLVALYMKVSW